MVKGFADLRQEMAQGQADLRKEVAADHEKLRNKIDKNVFWLLSVYLTTVLGILSVLAKLFIDVYAK
jgi:hypothetical protein